MHLANARSASIKRFGDGPQVAGKRIDPVYRPGKIAIVHRKGWNAKPVDASRLPRVAQNPAAMRDP
jgi:hypothetical protein